jgi:hypothetical protein
MKVKSRSQASLETVGDGFVLEPPLADEGFARLFDLFRRLRHLQFLPTQGRDRCANLKALYESLVAN